jgi:hypothetical protein
MINYENRPNKNTRIFQKSDIKLKEIIFFNKKSGKIKVGTGFALYISINRKRERKDRNRNEVQL